MGNLSKPNAISYSVEINRRKLSLDDSKTAINQTGMSKVRSLRKTTKEWRKYSVDNFNIPAKVKFACRRYYSQEWRNNFVDSSNVPVKLNFVRRRQSIFKHELCVNSDLEKLETNGRKHYLPPLLRFKVYARLVLICVRLCKYSYENVQASAEEYLSIIQVSDNYVASTADHGALYFDPAIYKANKEQRLPSDARKLLQKNPQLRTEKETEYLHRVLRNIKSFSEYPMTMQKQLCRVGWYEVYESKRAIVKQGHPPHAFYFILSGSVVVTSFDKYSGGTTFLVTLHKGMPFGELAVITRSKRQATVSTTTTTELLCISAKDFVNIFMSGGLKSITDPDQNFFIRSLPFLKHWPIECLATNPQACMFHFFGRGQVLVRDSSYCEWIYIVKSGSLSVLKKLVEVCPRMSNRNTDTDCNRQGSGNPASKSFGTWDFRIKKMKRLDSGTEKEVFKNNIEMEKRLEQTLPGLYTPRDRLGVVDYDEIITDHRSRVLPHNRATSVASVSDAFTLPKIAARTPETSSTMTDETIESDTLIKLPKIRKTSKGAYLVTTNSSKRKTTRKEAMQQELFQKQLEYDKQLLGDQKIGRKTITDELDNKLIKDFALTEKDIHPMFVEVQVLERGQYFGLTKIVFPEQAESFSVVSNGAECIMISKKFFLEKANEATMHHLRQVETLLPPEKELQKNLQDLADWKVHREQVYKRLVKNKQSRVVSLHQFPPQYSKQYCFRTGPTVRTE